MNIIPYSDFLKPQLIHLWERSVLATHDFLSTEDFEAIKVLVSGIDFYELDVYCLMEGEHSVTGFVGVADHTIEMLFLDPSFFGKGYGLQLLNFAVHEQKATKVDVNEQNKKAMKFYQKFGFEIVGRTDQDAQGRNYPLLKMQLPTKKLAV